MIEGSFFNELIFNCAIHNTLRAIVNVILLGVGFTNYFIWALRSRDR